MNGRLGTVSKVLCFVVKSGWPIWYNFKILYFSVKKTNDGLSTRIVKILKYHGNTADHI